MSALGWFATAAPANLWQSNAGTGAVVATSDPVGTLLDLSGQGFHLTSVADDATRPVFGTAAGVNWLGFDGANDLLRRLAAMNLYTATGFTAAFAIRSLATAADKYFCAQSKNGSANSVLTLARSMSVTGQHSSKAYVSDAGTLFLSPAFQTDAGNTFASGTDKVLIVVDDGSGVTDYTDGVAGTRQAYTRGGNALTTDQFGLGGLLGFAATFCMNARFYGGAVWPGVSDFSAGERAKILTTLGALQGRSL